MLIVPRGFWSLSIVLVAVCSSPGASYYVRLDLASDRNRSAFSCPSTPESASGWPEWPASPESLSVLPLVLLAATDRPKLRVTVVESSTAAGGGGATVGVGAMTLSSSFLQHARSGGSSSESSSSSSNVAVHVQELPLAFGTTVASDRRVGELLVVFAVGGGGGGAAAGPSLADVKAAVLAARHML